MNNDTGSNGIWDWQLVQLILGLSGILFVSIMFYFGIIEEGLRYNIRWSAKISFTLFCLAFSSQGLHQVVRNSFSWWLRMNRKFLGISFAIIHLIHLLFIIQLHIQFHPIFETADTLSLLAGGGAYLFVVIMLLTSFDTFSKMISNRTWKWIHTIGGYWIWVVFLSTYYSRVDEPIHWIFVIILVIVLLLRINVQYLALRKTIA